MRRGTSGINCLLGIDKPVGPSSHGVVSHIRRALGEKRIGHAGTLDPAASGVLLVGVGQATRLLGLLTLDDKRYVADIGFGFETNTDDAEGEQTRVAEVPAALNKEAAAKAALAAMVGPQSQVPPAFSAISVGGERSYKRARKGEQIELPARDIEIYSAKLLEIIPGETLVWRCEFYVSKGTYIRSIARDLARSLGTAAHLCGLRRTAAGSLAIANCYAPAQLEGKDAQEIGGICLDPVAALGFAVRQLQENERADVLNGKRIAHGLVYDAGSQVFREPRQGEHLCLVHEGLLLGVWERRGGVLASVASFPQGIQGVRS